MPKTITFVFGEDGSVHYDMDGFQGDACKKEALDILQALQKAGMKFDELRVQDKPEAYQKVAQKERAKETA